MKNENVVTIRFSDDDLDSLNELRVMIANGNEWFEKNLSRSDVIKIALSFSKKFYGKVDINENSDSM